MELSVYRCGENADATVGLLFINDDLNCGTVEDQYQEIKVPGETRIPPGRYKIKLRNIGKVNERYHARFPDIHKGMLWLQNVPNFTFIYLHIGNNEKQSAGCLLLGNILYIKQMIVGRSEEAYLGLYAEVTAVLEKGEDVYITINEDLLAKKKPHTIKPGDVGA